MGVPQAGKLAWPPPCPCNMHTVSSLHTVSSVRAAPHGGIMHEHDGMSMQRCLHHMAYTKV